jgi:ABC-2 type transport system ATP-binding protein
MLANLESENAVAFLNVKKTFPRTLTEPKKIGLDGFSFFLPQQKTLGLIGANGAGKSTSLKLVMNFIRPDSGNISIFGLRPDNNNIRKKIGYLPEIASFPPSLTVLDMLFFTGIACGLDRKTIRDRGEKLLNNLGLWEARKRQLRNYSKGMQQRASFAVALINEPELLILDEPMSGLDPLGRNLISNLILDLKTGNKTILFCSHILEDIDRIADLILVLHNGKKVYFGSPFGLLESRGKDNLTDAYVDLIGGLKSDV